ncbi:MAG: response regulator transcription factor [Burkholderiales bacterium]|nr:response regulator transcription factor [Burkholderiales bacterium]
MRGDKVLLIEDELKIAEFVTKGLKDAGAEVTHVTDGVTGLQVALQDAHDVLVLDIMLPAMNGIALMQELRQRGNMRPIIILSAKIDLEDRLESFEKGANDYLPKPFYVEELVARIKALKLKASKETPESITYKSLTLNLVNRHVDWQGITTILSPREFSLLGYLMRSPGHIYSRQQILKHVWAIDFDPETNIVDVCVLRIKRKLERKNAGMASPIESVRGVGYRLCIEALE